MTTRKTLTWGWLLAVLCVCALCSPALIAQDKSQTVVKQSLVSNNKKRTYYLLVPANLDAPAPLIVLLHGSGRDGQSLTDKWKELALKEGVIIAAPDSGGEGWSSPRDGPDFLRDLVEELKAKHPINPRRVYLFGHSAGAVFALMMSMVQSEYFAATAVHAGAFRSAAELQTINSATRKIPLAIWVGDRDRFFPLRDVRVTRDAFQAKGLPIEVTEMPGHDHWYYDLAPDINASAWAFLKKHELPNQQKYSQSVDLGTGNNINQVIAEVNSLNARAQELIERANEKEAEIGSKDFHRDRAAVNKIAREHMDILAESAAQWRAGMEKAEAVAKASSGKQKQYLTMIAQYNQKCAELLDIMRERSAALLSTDPFEVIENKRSEAEKRAGKLRQEIDEIQKAIYKLR
ncbi:MAG TPA: alpha/beta fold hydrolase [Pyrinomonadaceae bacterium]|nr:alpha/beta fold hydrolase [Pyrinomonadaceae bacterium]